MQNPVEQIELKAYEFWEERGRPWGTPWGTPEVDWFKAEGELAESTLSKVARGVGSMVGQIVAAVSDIERN